MEVHQEGDNLVVTGHQKHNSDSEHFERSMRRVIKMPKGVHHDSLRVEMNENGQLTVKADSLMLDQPAKRTIPINFKKSDKQKK